MKVKSVKKICWSIMAGVVILSNAGAMMTFANNHEDHLYEGYAGDGSDVPTLIRPKTDRTSAYAKNLNTNLTHRIEVAGTHATSGHGNVFGFDNCTEGTQWGYYDLKPGTYKYLRNTVYEKGYRYAYLVFTEAHHKTGWMRGLWSPDSI